MICRMILPPNPASSDTAQEMGHKKGHGFNGKAPAIHGRGKLSRAGVSDQFGPSRSAFTGRAEHPLVAGHTSWVLFICAKNCPTGRGTKTFEIDQSFEPGARNRRPTIDVGGCEDARSSMSDAFDSLD